MDKTQDKEIENLKKELEKYKKITESQKLKIKELESKIKSLNSKNENDELVESLLNEISQKNEELEKLKKELEKLNKNTMTSSRLYSLEEIKSINFSSMDQKIHFSTTCVDGDTFAEVEEKLYKQFPEYRETNNIFLVEGKQILRFKTIGENNIKPGFPVMLVVPS